MESVTKKRILWGLLGAVYAVLYGFWTMLATGGGHGNFIWFVLFLLAYLFGLFFPIMGFLVADLRPIWTKSAFAAILIVHFALTALYLFPLLTGNGGEVLEDVQESWDRSQFMFLLMTAVHILPVVFFTVAFVRSVIWSEQDDSAEISSLL